MLLTFDFKTVEEAQKFLEDLVAVRRAAPESQAGQSNAAPATGSSQDDKPKRGRKKAETAQPAPAPEPAPEVTKDEAYAALESVLNIVGFEAARQILADFKAVRFPDVKPEQYAALVTACKDKL